MFPSLTDHRTYCYVNLNEHAARWLARHGVTADMPNPLLDPSVSNEMVESIHRAYGVTFTYGGWLEDRGVKLRGTYLDAEKKYLHLGIDVNVPAGTAVSLDYAAEVVHIRDDHPEEGGWGPRVIFRLLDFSVYLVYGHLADISVSVGEHLEAGWIFALVGSSERNGGWFPHVHVQVIPAWRYDELAANDFRDLDGYGHPSDYKRLARENPDPIQYIKLGV